MAGRATGAPAAGGMAAPPPGGDCGRSGGCADGPPDATTVSPREGSASCGGDSGSVGRTGAPAGCTGRAGHPTDGQAGREKAMAEPGGHRQAPDVERDHAGVLPGRALHEISLTGRVETGHERAVGQLLDQAQFAQKYTQIVHNEWPDYRGQWLREHQKYTF